MMFAYEIVRGLSRALQDSDMKNGMKMSVKHGIKRG